MTTFTYSSKFPETFVFRGGRRIGPNRRCGLCRRQGESVWDHFARIPGKVVGGDNLDVACDHYNRFDEDFALMAFSLGVKHYRLSIAWPRIYPKGDDQLNQAGLDFYHRLFASMAKHGITPWVTMFHWDLPPQALEEKGGWTSRATADAFRIYADTIVKAFSGVVKNWITLNEIRCFTVLGYGTGTKARAARSLTPSSTRTYHVACCAMAMVWPRCVPTAARRASA